MKRFQIIIIGVFIFFIIAGVIAFATFRGGDRENMETVTIWGTLPARDFSDLLTTLRTDLGVELSANYHELRREEFDRELVEALASGAGPDMILLPQDLILRHQDKVFAISFESLSERDFKDRFIEEGELYLTGGGIIGLPFNVDPLVMYWNRTMFANAGLAQPPQYWDEFFAITQRLTERDERGNIIKSAVALGEFVNVSNAKELLTTLFMQAGTPIVVKGTNHLDAVLSERFGMPEIPAESALRFYTEFADPVKVVYSWNRSLPGSQNVFLSGNLGIYFGFASELFELQEQNPNLNFDVAPMPQARGADAQKTFGAMNALAVLKRSPRVASAIRALGILTDAQTLAVLEAQTGLPPVRRDLLSIEQTDAFRSVFYDAAIISDAFLDPDPSETEAIFRAMVEDVTSGRERVSVAVSQANRLLDSLVR